MKTPSPPGLYPELYNDHFNQARRPAPRLLAGAAVQQSRREPGKKSGAALFFGQGLFVQGQFFRGASERKSIAPAGRKHQQPAKVEF